MTDWQKIEAIHATMDIKWFYSIELEDCLQRRLSMPSTKGAHVRLKAGRGRSGNCLPLDLKSGIQSDALTEGS